MVHEAVSATEGGGVTTDERRGRCIAVVYSEIK